MRIVLPVNNYKIPKLIPIKTIQKIVKIEAKEEYTTICAANSLSPPISVATMYEVEEEGVAKAAIKPTKKLPLKLKTR